MSTATPNEIHQLRLQQLAAFLRDSELILTAWDAYSDEHTGNDGWPHDTETYGRRAARRDADTWRSFNRVRQCAKDLIATAEVQLQQLPSASTQSRWAWQLATLDGALDRLTALQREWLDAREILPPSARPGTEAYDDVIGNRNAEAWHSLNEWSAHGQALLDIHAAAQHTPPPPPATAPAPAAPAQAAKPTAARR
ncbi:hypothetical protein OG607_41130 [Streptomyces sp. NBC_01537]|uniref:hypothetical protein n=1 Tax=Streptomyces sp. NBC_01537 TaxID=2903896 RepID=UPI00386B7A45